MSNALRLLHLRNFKSFASANLELGPLTVLAGLNGTGKSNLLDAMRFLQESLAGGLEPAVTRRGGITGLRRAPGPQGRPPDVEIGARVHIGNDVAEYKFVIEAATGGEWKIKTEFFQHHKNGALNDARFERTYDRISLAGLTIDDSRYEELIELLIGDKNLFLPLVAGHPAVKDVFRFLSDIGVYSIFPDALRTPQPPMPSYPLDEHGQNLASVLKSLRDRRRIAANRIRDVLAATVPQVQNYRVQPVGGYLSIQIEQRFRGANHWFDAHQCSDGTLRILGLATALHQDPPRSLIGIEEPELTVHPGAAGVLCDELVEAAERTQIVLTTHSPDLISRLPIDSLRVVEMTEQGSEVGKVASDQIHAVQEAMFSSGDLVRVEGLRREIKE